MTDKFDDKKTKELSNFLAKTFAQKNFEEAKSAKYRISSRVKELVEEGADPRIEVEAKKGGEKHDVASLMDKIGAVNTAQFCREKVVHPENIKKTERNEKGIAITPNKYDQHSTEKLMSLMGRNNGLLEGGIISKNTVIDIREQIADLINNKNADPNALVHGAGKDRVPHFLARMGAIDTINELKAKHPEMDFNLKGERGNTPLHIALTSEYNLSSNRNLDHMDKLLEVLIQFGADSNERNDNGDAAKAAFYKPQRMRYLKVGQTDKTPLSAEEEKRINNEVTADLNSSSTLRRAADAIYKHIDNAKNQSSPNSPKVSSHQLEAAKDLLKDLSLIECSESSRICNHNRSHQTNNMNSALQQFI